ncbi:MAG: hypothetical protein Ta2A_18650 [Treponemataceae bacterium]|nr:MAG: hypothetical protein Ta2A_18650 [Treponemataceae bacterium]
MKKILTFLLLIFSSTSLFAQLQANDYTNAFEIGYDKSINGEHGLSVSYSWIYYMGYFGNVAIRPEFALHYHGGAGGIGILGFSYFGLPVLYSYDFGGAFHITPYVGLGVYWFSYSDSSNSVIYGIKILHNGFGIYGEVKNFYAKEISTFSVGVTFEFGTNYIPTPARSIVDTPQIRERERDYF